LLLELLLCLLRLNCILLRLIGNRLKLLLPLGCYGLRVAHDLLLALDRRGHCAADRSLHGPANGRQVCAAY